MIGSTTAKNIQIHWDKFYVLKMVIRKIVEFMEIFGRQHIWKYVVNTICVVNTTVVLPKELMKSWTVL